MTINKEDLPKRWRSHYEDSVIQSYLFEKHHTKGRLGAAEKNQDNLLAINPKVRSAQYIQELTMYNEQVNNLSTRLTEIDRLIDLHIADKKTRFWTTWTPIAALVITIFIFIFSEFIKSDEQKGMLKNLEARVSNIEVANGLKKKEGQASGVEAKNSKNGSVSRGN